MSAGRRGQKRSDGHDDLNGMFRVGLTGGIASGKTAVSDTFAELGVPVIDTDRIAREVVAPGRPALEEIEATFGPEILQPDGTLDRRALRALVFADPSQRQALEAIVHPRIREATLARMRTAGGPYQIIVVPLLVESGFAALVDRVLVVDCPPELQRARLVARDEETVDTAESIMRSQADREARLAAADDVIDNSGTLAETREQVRRLHERYLSLAERGR